MFYRLARFVVRIILFIINGNAHYENKEALPEGPYVLVAPHRTWWDPLILALAGAPRQYAFMAKEELFHKNFILTWILKHAHVFGVDRANPGPSVVKTPVKMLKNDDLSVMIFPTGSRYSSDLKGGAILIAKLAKVPIVPAVYQGPVKFSHIFLRKRITVRYGAPIELPAGRTTPEYIEAIGNQMQASFDQIDHEIDPNFKYIPNEEKYLKEKEEGKVK